MTAPLREQHKNFAQTTLNGAINNSVTTITVSSGTVFPSTGNFRVMVDSEIMKVTARSTNDLTVVRGQEGTSAASHSSGATIALIHTTAGITRLFQDNDPLFGYSSVKPMAQLFADDGKTILTASDFTWQNQGGATSTDEDGTILLACPTESSQNLRILERTPASTPYTYIAALSCYSVSDGAASPHIGMAFRETSSSKLQVFAYSINDFFNGYHRCSSQRWNSPTSRFTVNKGDHYPFMSGCSQGPGMGKVWMKMENDGTNIKFYMGPDGFSWIEYFSETKNTFFSSGPDRLCFFGFNEGNSKLLNVRLHHWSKGE